MMENIVNIRITNKCNNDCMFCLEQSLRVKPDLSMENLKNNIKKKFKKTVKNELIITGGNPILNKNVLKIIDFSREMGYNKIRIIFNGNFKKALISREELLDSGITDITFLGHSCRQDIHDKLCGESGSFSELIKSIKFFSQKIDLRICVNVNGLNIKQLPNIVDGFIKRNIKAFDFLNYFPVERAYDKFDEYLFYNIEDNFDYFQRTFEILQKNSIKSWWNRFPEYIFENYEFLMPRKENIRNEITGDEYKMFESCLKNKTKPVCFGRCRFCFLKNFCTQLFTKKFARKQFDNKPVCQGGKGKFDTTQNHIKEFTLDNFFDVYLKNNYRLKGIRCKFCRYDKFCSGIFIDDVRDKGFKQMIPM
ncbi:radical SAM protein [Candidatus Parcubacteria bacterium]|nr:radical SAM protein [Candidatus Parcubacteria bacterium]